MAKSKVRIVFYLNGGLALPEIEQQDLIRFPHLTIETANTLDEIKNNPPKYLVALDFTDLLELANTGISLVLWVNDPTAQREWIKNKVIQYKVSSFQALVNEIS